MKKFIVNSVEKKRERSRVLIFFCLGCIFLSSPVFARLSIGLRSDRKSYIKYEPINVTVKLTNYTGNNLDFGESQNPRGTFKILVSRKSKYGGGDKVAERDDIVGGLRLRAGTTRSITFQINNMYNFQDAANYRIKAQIGHPRLQSDYQSSALNIDVRNGTEVWSRTIGVPSNEIDHEGSVEVKKGDDADNEQPIQKRKISLRRVHLVGEEIYALRVEDDRHVYNVARLGKFIHGGQPMCRVDAMSNIYTLLRVKSRLFVCKVFDFNGNLLEREFYVIDNTIPALHRSPAAGTVTVVGGREAVEGEDYVETSEDDIGVKELPPALGGRGTGVDEMKRFGQ